MEMNHPQWPVVRESARRLVKNEAVIIAAPHRYGESITDLSNHISDHIPQRTSFPEHQLAESEEIWIFQRGKDMNEAFVYIGPSEPDITVCWINMNLDEGFQSVIDSCLQLLRAGYPGCVGCDSTPTETRWNEYQFRNQEK